MAQCEELMGEDLSCYLKQKFDRLIYENVRMIIVLPTEGI